MKNYISNNIGYLVKKNNLSQDDFGGLFDLKKGVINQYIQGKSLPKIETLQKICNHFDITLDELVNSDLSKSTNGTRDPLQHSIATETINNDKDAIIAAQRETIETQRELIANLRSQLSQAS